MAPATMSLKNSVQGSCSNRPDGFTARTAWEGSCLLVLTRTLPRRCSRRIGKPVSRRGNTYPWQPWRKKTARAVGNAGWMNHALRLDRPLAPVAAADGVLRARLWPKALPESQRAREGLRPLASLRGGESLLPPGCWGAPACTGRSPAHNLRQSTALPAGTIVRFLRLIGSPECLPR
jgi:hypothetical protein